jgi:hypothetical protein
VGFGLCDVSVFYRRTFNVIITSTEAQRKLWLDEVKAIIDSKVFKTLSGVKE